MAIIVTAPDEYYGVWRSRWPSLFLAGAITGCPDWQKELIELLRQELLVIYNPRRENFPIDEGWNAAEVQIGWEYDKLARADIVSFWFAYGTDNPIVLYELGMWGNSRFDRPIAVGFDPKYTRKHDVEIQTGLARPDVVLVTSIDNLAKSIRDILAVMRGAT